MKSLHVSFFKNLVITFFVGFRQRLIGILLALQWAVTGMLKKLFWPKKDFWFVNTPRELCNTVCLLLITYNKTSVVIRWYFVMAYYFKINVYLPRLQNNVAYSFPGRDGKDYNKHVRSTVWVQTIATTFFFFFFLNPNGTNTQTGAGLCWELKRGVDEGSVIDYNCLGSMVQRWMPTEMGK